MTDRLTDEQIAELERGIAAVKAEAAAGITHYTSALAALELQATKLLPSLLAEVRAARASRSASPGAKAAQDRVDKIAEQEQHAWADGYQAGVEATVRAVEARPPVIRCAYCGEHQTDNEAAIRHVRTECKQSPHVAAASPPEEQGRCTALDGMPRCTQPPVPGTSTCWAHGGDLIAAAVSSPSGSAPGNDGKDGGAA